MDLRALQYERNAQINTLHDIQLVSRPGMDKPAKRLTRERQFRVRVPIGELLLVTVLINLFIGAASYQLMF